jgi:hypothetical protein
MSSSAEPFTNKNFLSMAIGDKIRIAHGCLKPTVRLTSAHWLNFFAFHRYYSGDMLRERSRIEHVIINIIALMLLISPSYGEDLPSYQFNKLEITAGTE